MPSALLTALVMSPAAAKNQQITAKNGYACRGNMSGLLLSRCLWADLFLDLTKQVNLLLLNISRATESNQVKAHLDERFE